MFTRAWSRYREHQTEMQALSSVDVIPPELPEVQALNANLENIELDIARGRSLEDSVMDGPFSREQSPAPLPEVDLSACFAAPRPPPLPPVALINVEVSKAKLLVFRGVIDLML